MLSSLRSSLRSLHQKAKIFSKRKKHKGFDEPSTQSFASMGVTNQFKQVFRIIDANDDGNISAFELSEVLLRLGRYEKSKATEEARGMVMEMDCNGDGVIDLDEFIEVVINGEEDNLMDAFLLFDRDKNGLISAKELRRVLINLGCDKCSLQECKRMIKAVDKNGDGFIDFKEFKSMMIADSNL